VQNLVATPSLDISSSNPVALSASSPAAGSWSVRIFNQAGDEVTSAGMISNAPTNGTTLNATWAPNSYYSATGPHSAVIEVNDGRQTQTGTIFFTVYNFPVKVNGWKFLNAAGIEIPSPKAGETFYLSLDVRNLSSATLASVFLPLMVANQYIGAAEVRNMAPGQSIALTFQVNALPAGSFPVQCYLWTGPSGSPLAQVMSLAVTVVP
jgi:hypothetical protein